MFDLIATHAGIATDASGLSQGTFWLILGVCLTAAAGICGFLYRKIEKTELIAREGRSELWKELRKAQDELIVLKTKGEFGSD